MAVGDESEPPPGNRSQASVPPLGGFLGLHMLAEETFFLQVSLVVASPTNFIPSLSPS